MAGVADDCRNRSSQRRPGRPGSHARGGTAAPERTGHPVPRPHHPRRAQPGGLPRPLAAAVLAPGRLHPGLHLGVHRPGERCTTGSRRWAAICWASRWTACSPTSPGCAASARRSASRSRSRSPRTSSMAVATAYGMIHPARHRAPRRSARVPDRPGGHPAHCSPITRRRSAAARPEMLLHAGGAAAGRCLRPVDAGELATRRGRGPAAPARHRRRGGRNPRRPAPRPGTTSPAGMAAMSPQRRLATRRRPPIPPRPRTPDARCASSAACSTANFRSPGSKRARASAANLSQQLAQFRDAGIVTTRRAAKSGARGRRISGHASSSMHWARPASPHGPDPPHPPWQRNLCRRAAPGIRPRRQRRVRCLRRRRAIKTGLRVNTVEPRMVQSMHEAETAEASGNLADASCFVGTPCSFARQHWPRRAGPLRPTAKQYR